MRSETNILGPIQHDYVRDLSFTLDGKLIGANDSGRIMICCQASMSWLESRIRRSLYCANDKL